MRTTSSTKKKKPSTRAKAELALTTLAPGEARHLAKPRAGFENWVETLAALYAKYPDELGKGDVDIDLMRSSLATYQSLAAPQAEAAARHALYDDSRLVESAAVWTQMMAIYRRGKVAGTSNKEVARMLADFERWMKRGPQKKSAAAPVTTP